jgi:hypothetical protein
MKRQKGHNRLSVAHLNEQTKRIQQAIDEERQRNQDQHFTLISQKEIERKLKKALSSGR